MNRNGLQYLQYLRDIKLRGIKVCTKIESALTITNTLKSTGVYLIKQACVGMADECADLYLKRDGKELKYSPTAVKKYLREVLDTDFYYLQDVRGSIHYDIPHLMIASEVLKSKGKIEDSDRVLGVCNIINANAIGENLETMYNRGKPLKITLNLSTLESTKYPDYNRRYMAKLTVPNGYDCYIYEPKFIAQYALLSAVFGVSYDNLDNYVGLNSDGTEKQGLLMQYIPQSMENQFFSTIMSFDIKRLDGYFGLRFLNLYSALQERASVGGVYCHNIIPAMAELMANAFYIPFKHDLAQLSLLTERDCFINYATLNRLAFCVPQGYDINNFPSIASKVTLLDKTVNYRRLILNDY